MFTIQVGKYYMYFVNKQDKLKSSIENSTFFVDHQRLLLAISAFPMNYYSKLLMLSTDNSRYIDNLYYFFQCDLWNVIIKNNWILSSFPIPLLFFLPLILVGERRHLYWRSALFYEDLIAYNSLNGQDQTTVIAKPIRK